MEKVSVIVPVYNGEKSLERCAGSILSQDYPELELILVDDGSRDRSWELMQMVAAADHRVKAIHQENGGVSSARNRALAEARGTYVQFADVDDWLPMDATKMLVREMEAQSSELAVGDFYRVVDGIVSEKGSIETGGVLTLRQYADAMMLSPADLYYGVLWNKLYRRDIIEQYSIRMDENISYSEDMIFNLEYLLHVKSVAILKAPVYYYRYTKGSLVDQSLNLSSTIKMKKSVIGYYNEFFRKTFDAPSYQERLPVIYGYLLAVSHDSLALPFTPGTRKLNAGTDLSALSGESGAVFPMRSAILEARLLGRYLETLARKRGMDEARIKLLYCMEKMKEPCSVDSLCLLTGMGKPAVIVATTRLLADGLVRRESPLGGKERFSFHAPELAKELRQLDQDADAVRFAGFTEEQIRQYRELEEQIGNHILHHLQGEQATES
ncbi:MAG: glycosyltransferase family 2 protein [Oscillospiraceae bacterium]|nr:glycosyltransferase family 2 protein [Oscillospiraceae bacterium]